jgi:CheY-like chemotaxis protein
MCNPRVLIVDDEVPNLSTFQRAFRKHYDIHVASSGPSGLQALAEKQFDVVLSDFGMPAMTGAEFVAKARELQQVAIVMVTGYMDEPRVRALETSGEIFGIVGKPWERGSIVEIVERATEHTRSKR